MKKILSLLSLCLLIISCAKKEQPLQNSLLWEISGNGLEEPSYLFGTIHITCDATLKNKVKNALDQTSLLVLEIDLDDLDVNAFIEGLHMTNNTTLADLTTDDEYETLKTFAKNHIRKPLEEMETYKPYHIYSAVYPTMLDCPMESFEVELMKIAQQQNKEILGLETVEEQMKVFEDISYETQLKFLLNAANDDLKEEKEIFQQMLDVYDAEEINKLIDLIAYSSEKVTDNYLDVILNDRNKKWIPKIKSYSMEQPIFYGVGAGHLAGKEGVINLLRQEGFTVKAVK